MEKGAVRALRAIAGNSNNSAAQQTLLTRAMGRECLVKRCMRALLAAYSRTCTRWPLYSHTAKRPCTSTTIPMGALNPVRLRNYVYIYNNQLMIRAARAVETAVAER